MTPLSNAGLDFDRTGTAITNPFLSGDNNANQVSVSLDSDECLLKDAQAESPAFEGSDTGSRRELVLLQEGIENVDRLLAELIGNQSDVDYDVFLLSRDESGFSQIDDLLQQYSNLDAIISYPTGPMGSFS